MANYTGDKRPDELDALTTLADTDVLVAFDADDADSKTKKITKANLVAGLAIAATQIADGTVSNTEFQYLNGVTSAIQTQIDGKAATSHTHSASDITSGTLTHERGGLEADVSAYDGLIRITGGTTSNVSSTVFETGGAMEIDGDKIDIDWTPTNYTPSTTPTEADNADNLTAHLYGIDQALGSAGGSTTCISIMPASTQPRGGSVTSVTMNSNTTGYCMSFDLPFDITVNKLSFRNASVTVSGTCDIGIYSEDGQTKHIDITTATMTGAGVVHTAVSSVSLSAGRYYVVFVPNGTLNCEPTRYTFVGVSYADSGEPVYIGTLTVTAGTLPSTFNPTTDITFSSSNTAPIIRLDS